MKLSVSALVLILLSCFAGPAYAIDDEEKQIQVSVETIETILAATISKNRFVQMRAYSLLASQKDITEKIDSKKLYGYIAVALEGNDSKLAKLGLEILDNAKLSDDDRQELLMRAIGPGSTIQQEALERLNEHREDLLPKIIRDIEKHPTRPHTEHLRLIEYWGPDAKSVVPALVKHFESLLAKSEWKRKQEEKQRELKELKRRADQERVSGRKIAPRPIRQPDLTQLKFDFLNIVYAFSEIGSDAIEAMPIALAAANVKRVGKRQSHSAEEYQTAGILCIERLLDAEPGEQVQIQRALGGLLGSGGGGAVQMLGGGLGGTFSGNASSSVRSQVKKQMTRNSLAQTAKASEARRARQIDREVEMKFQNHDVLPPYEKLTVNEIRSFDPPLLLSDADNDGDQAISKAELRSYLQLASNGGFSDEMLKQKFGSSAYNTGIRTLQKYDTDNNGVLDSAERSTANWGAPSPSESDKNQDGLLSKYELILRYFEREN